MTQLDYQVRIRSCGRLHFGLLEISEGNPNRFGGIGLMVDYSHASLAAKPCDDSKSQVKRSDDSIVVSQSEYWKERIENQLENWRTSNSSNSSMEYSLGEFPRPHCGLGSGTQMACTVAALLLALQHATLALRKASQQNLIEALLRCDAEGRDLNQNQLRSRMAFLSQRGKRSNVGLFGFLYGGFIVDRGMVYDPQLDREQSDLDQSNRETLRFEFPKEWPIILVRTEAIGDHGTAESAMFERCSAFPNPNRARMIQVIDRELIPSLERRDWNTFSSAIGNYGQLAGQVFELVQGGLYRTPRIAEQIQIMRQIGLSSATQSSWGPTVCAFAKDDSHAIWCADRLRGRIPDAVIHVVGASNRPAQMELV